MESIGNDRRSRETVRRAACRRIVPLLSAVAVGLALTAAPALAQQDRCYPGLDCPEDILRNAPPRDPSPPPQRRYDPRTERDEPPSPRRYDPRAERDEPPLSRRSLQLSYSAQAFCSITGVLGFAYDVQSPEAALMAAIYDCIRKGGVPQCCQHGARLTD